MKEAIEKLQREIQCLEEQKEGYVLDFLGKEKAAIERDISALEYALEILDKA